MLYIVLICQSDIHIYIPFLSKNNIRENTLKTKAFSSLYFIVLFFQILCVCFSFKASTDDAAYHSRHYPCTPKFCQRQTFYKSKWCPIACCPFQHTYQKCTICCKTKNVNNTNTNTGGYNKPNIGPEKRMILDNPILEITKLITVITITKWVYFNFSPEIS